MYDCQLLRKFVIQLLSTFMAAQLLSKLRTAQIVSETWMVAMKRGHAIF